MIATVIRKSMAEFDKMIDLRNGVCSSLENYVAARTAIRDFIISTDGKYYAVVEERIAVATESLARAEANADRDEMRSTIHRLYDAIRTWSAIAQQVRDAFSSYQETIRDKLLANFYVLSQAGRELLQTNPTLVGSVILDVQTANASVTGYLMNGDGNLIEDTQRAIDSAKKTIEEAEKKDEHTIRALQSFSIALEAYEAGFREAINRWKNAHQLFHEHLAPSGVQIQADLEQFHNQIVDDQRRNEDLKKAYHALEEVSLTDPLTGLWNRRFLDQHVDSDVAMTVRQYESWLKTSAQPLPVGADMVFLLVDLDHFKSVNDRYGHAAGDKILMQMRERLQKVFRESDYLIRWGGEEFLIVARGINRAEGEIMAERICTAVREQNFELEDDLNIVKTCSVGFACFPFLPNHPRSLSWPQVIKLADQALYMAKHGGRNGWVGLFATEQTRPEDVLKRLAQATIEAVSDGELRLTTNLNLKAA